MPLSWSTYCFLPYFIGTFSSSADRTPCNSTIYETLKYCGNLDMYRKFNKNSGFAFNYTSFGKFCYAYSNDFQGSEELGMSEAQERCEQDGAHLPEFKTRIDWEEYLTFSDQSSMQFNWIGAEVSGGNCTWLKSNKEIQIGHITWGAIPPKTAGRQCIIQMGKSWYTFRCEAKRPYYCQKYGKEAYEGKATLTINAQGRDGSIKSKEGYSVKFSCSARSERKMIISVQMKDSSLFSVEDEGKKNRTMNGISFSDIQTKFTYYYDHLRCFQYVQLTMTVKLSRELVGAQILCNRRIADEEMEWLNGLGSSQVLKIQPFIPEVKLVNQLGSENITLGNNIEYYCVSKFGEDDRVTFVLVQGESYWGRSFSINGISSDVGTMPDWFNKVEIEEGRDDAYGGNFINVSLAFKFVYSMIDTQFGCYSENALQGVRTKSVKPGDKGSNWCDLPAQSVHIIATLTALAKETHEADKCPTTTDISCLVIHTGNGSMVFQTSDLDGQGTVTFNAQNSEMTTLPRWLNIIDYHESVHPIYGPFTNVLLEETGVEKVEDQDIKCKVFIGTDFIQDTYLLFSEKESQPPQVTQQFYDSENKYFMSFKCLSHLGEGETKTWKLSDDTDTIHIWFVTKDGNVSGSAPLPWLEIQFMSSTWYFACGYSVTSIIKIRRQRPTNAHTIACYSYNISEVSNSSYTDEMIENFTIPDIQAGTIKSDSTTDPPAIVAYILLFFLVLGVALVFASKSFIKDNPGENSGVEEEQMHVRAQLASHMTELEDIGTEKVSPKDENVDVSCISEDSIIRSSRYFNSLRKVSTIPASHTDEELLKDPQIEATIF